MMRSCGSHAWSSSFVLLLVFFFGVYALALFSIVKNSNYVWVLAAVVMLVLVTWPFVRVCDINRRNDRLLRECHKYAPALDYTMLGQYFQGQPLGFSIYGVYVTRALIFSVSVSALASLISGIMYEFKYLA